MSLLDSVLYAVCVWSKVVKYVERDVLVRVVTPEEIEVRVMRRPDDVRICVAVVV